MSHSRWPRPESRLPTPEWFGVIKPSRASGVDRHPGGRANNKDLKLQFDPIDMPESEVDDEDEDDDGGKSERAGFSSCSSPLFNNQSMSDYFRKMFGGSAFTGEGKAGAEMTVRSIRRVQEIGPNARPLPTRIQFTDDGKAGAAVGVGGALYPEWDVFNDRYKPDWCRVIDFSADRRRRRLRCRCRARRRAAAPARPASDSARRSCVAVPMGTTSTSRRSSTCSSICNPASPPPSMST